MPLDFALVKSLKNAPRINTTASRARIRSTTGAMHHINIVIANSLALQSLLYLIIVFNML